MSLPLDDYDRDPAITDRSLILENVDAYLNDILAEGVLGEFSIEHRDASSLSYQEYQDRFLARNLPVLITDITDSWPASRDFLRVTHEVEGAHPQLNYSFLRDHFGDSVVSCTDTASAQGGGYGAGHIVQMPFREYLDNLERIERSEAAATAPRLLYLKDFHFVAAHRGRYAPYDTPVFFSDDWLNEYLDDRDRVARGNEGATDAVCSDYRFLYLGPHGTRTPFHTDVLKSYSWSANIAGAKRWWLLRPRYTFLLYDRDMREMAPFFSASDSEAHERSSTDDGHVDPDEDLAALVARCKQRARDPNVQFPWLPLAERLATRLDQPAGSALFVPSGWAHAVLNTGPGPTLSLNHNWINGYNVHWSIALLVREYEVAAHLLEDLRHDAEFAALVDRNVQQNCGFSLREFGARGMLGLIARRAAVDGSERGAARRAQVRAALEAVVRGMGPGRRVPWVDVRAEEELLGSLDHQFESMIIKYISSISDL